MELLNRVFLIYPSKATPNDEGVIHKTLYNKLPLIQWGVIVK